MNLDGTTRTRDYCNQLAVQLGLEPAGRATSFEDTVVIETLPELGDLHFFYVVQDDNNVFARAAILPLWQSLEFVQREQAYALGGDTWLFGGPLSAEVLVDRVMNLLAADALTTTTQAHEGNRVVTHAMDGTH